MWCTRPKRRTTARSPGRTSLTPVRSQATRSTNGTRRTSQRRTSLASVFCRRLHPFHRRQGGEEQPKQLSGPHLDLRLVHGQVANLPAFQLGVVVAVLADGLVENQIGLGIGLGTFLLVAALGVGHVDADLRIAGTDDV